MSLDTIPSLEKCIESLILKQTRGALYFKDAQVHLLKLPQNGWKARIIYTDKNRPSIENPVNKLYEGETFTQIFSDWVRRKVDTTLFQEELDYTSHPKYQLIQDWIGDSEENKEWFEENKQTLFADLESITIAGFVLALKPLEGLYRYADGLEALSKTNHQKYPDWKHIIQDLPGDGANKSNFLQNVLGLSFGGYKDTYSIPYDQDISGSVWSTSHTNDVATIKFTGKELSDTTFIFIDNVADALIFSLDGICFYQDDSGFFHSVLGSK